MTAPIMLAHSHIRDLSRFLSAARGAESTAKEAGML
jgi:hypothetical protein